MQKHSRSQDEGMALSEANIPTPDCHTAKGSADVRRQQRDKPRQREDFCIVRLS